jgi:hypothetical protein
MKMQGRTYGHRALLEAFLNPYQAALDQERLPNGAAPSKSGSAGGAPSRKSARTLSTACTTRRPRPLAKPSPMLRTIEKRLTIYRQFEHAKRLKTEGDTPEQEVRDRRLKIEDANIHAKQTGAISCSNCC